MPKYTTQSTMVAKLIQKKKNSNSYECTIERHIVLSQWFKEKVIEETAERKKER